MAVKRSATPSFKESNQPDHCICTKTNDITFKSFIQDLLVKGENHSVYYSYEKEHHEHYFPIAY